MDQPLTKKVFALHAQPLTYYFAVNAFNKSNHLTDGNLINEWEKPWTELKVQLLVENEGYWLGLSVTLILLTVNEQMTQMSNVASPTPIFVDMAQKVLDWGC